MSRDTRARLCVIAVCLCTALPLIVGHAQGELQLGDMTYSRAPAPALRMPVTRSSGFFRGVGGVAFSAVATGQNGLVVTGLRYDATARDGQRLLITVRSKSGATRTVRGNIYDWQMVPTARYALDNNGSAVTLFGELQDKGAAQRVRTAGGNIINYHPELDNTLLGLRLFQADILIIRPDAADLFKQDGRVLLGNGESGHNFRMNLERYRRLSEWQDVQKRTGNQYQSYVVGDLGQRVTFTVQGRSLAFTGEPYWNAWRSKYRSEADRARRETLVNSHKEKVHSYNALVDKINSRQAPANARSRLAALQVEIDGIEKRVKELDAIEQMPEYSKALSQQIRKLGGVNPVVYGAVKTVMHYRALFKHLQTRNKAAYSTFVGSLRTVPVRPPVMTPTIERPLPVRQ